MTTVRPVPEKTPATNLPLWKRRIPMLLLGVLFLTCYILGFGYHVLEMSIGGKASPALQVVYFLTTSLGYASLWLFLDRFVGRAGDAPVRAFWSTFAGGVILLGTAGGVMRIGGVFTEFPGSSVPVGFDLTTGVPIALPIVVKLTIVSFCITLFVFVLFHRLRDLVLVKRNKSSQRNWRVMFGLMLITSVLAVFESPRQEIGTAYLMLLILSVVLMVVNAFRLSWIVFLSFREKMAEAALCLLLLLLTLFGVGFEQTALIVPGADVYLAHYSMALSSFVTLCVIFSTIYLSTSFLSLLFHLPMSGDYQQRQGERAAMHSLAHLVGQVFDAEKLYATIAAAPVEAGAANASWLAIPDLQSGTMKPVIVSAHHIGRERIEELVDMQAFFDEVSQGRETVVVEQAVADHRLKVRAGSEIGSLMVVPLIARDEILGTLFATKEVVRGFEKDDVETVGLFAAQASVAIDNARLFEQQIEKERLTRELAIAREVQRKLLPQSLPRIQGLSVAASSVSAQEVGGDYYDFVRIDEDRTGIIIGDVSGKGTSAAFYMAEMQGIFHSVSRLATSPADFLHHANMALSQSLDRNVFITAVYAILDTAREELVLARAGHCPMALIPLSGEARYIRTAGLGLGLDRSKFFGGRLTEDVLPLQPGDVFVLYTDGVVESRAASGEEYGYDRLLQVLSRHRHEDAEDVHDAVLQDLRRFLGSSDYDDDLTLLVLKWHGLPVDAVRQSTFAMEESS